MKMEIINRIIESNPNLNQVSKYAVINEMKEICLNNKSTQKLFNIVQSSLLTKNEYTAKKNSLNKLFLNSKKIDNILELKEKIKLSKEKKLRNEKELLELRSDYERLKSKNFLLSNKFNKLKQENISLLAKNLVIKNSKNFENNSDNEKTENFILKNKMVLLKKINQNLDNMMSIQKNVVNSNYFQDKSNEDDLFIRSMNIKNEVNLFQEIIKRKMNSIDEFIITFKNENKGKIDSDIINSILFLNSKDISKILFSDFNELHSEIDSISKMFNDDFLKEIKRKNQELNYKIDQFNKNCHFIIINNHVNNEEKLINLNIKEKNNFSKDLDFIMIKLNTSGIKITTEELENLIEELSQYNLLQFIERENKSDSDYYKALNIKNLRERENLRKNSEFTSQIISFEDFGNSNIIEYTRYFADFKNFKNSCLNKVKENLSNIMDSLMECEKTKQSVEKFVNKKIMPQLNLIEELFESFAHKCNQEIELFKYISFSDVIVNSSYKNYGYNFEKMIMSSKYISNISFGFSMISILIISLNKYFIDKNKNKTNKNHLIEFNNDTLEKINHLYTEFDKLFKIENYYTLNSNSNAKEKCKSEENNIVDNFQNISNLNYYNDCTKNITSLVENVNEKSNFYFKKISEIDAKADFYFSTIKDVLKLLDKFVN